MAAYLAVQTQWRHGGMGSRTGLDYGACIDRLALALPRWQGDGAGAFAGLTVDDLMGDVQIIETGLLEADSEKREQNKTEPT